jgi:homoserine/homoserine lactone efflux protein
VVTQAANPKALVFFTAILPQFIEPASPLLPQVLILGASSFVIEVIVLSLYVATCHTAHAWIGQRRFTGLLQRLGGACLIVAGARLALTRRT